MRRVYKLTLVVIVILVASLSIFYAYRLFFGRSQPVVNHAVVNHGFLQKIVEFTNENEYVVSFDIDASGNNVAVLALAGDTPRENVFDAYVYLLDDGGTILKRRQVDGIKTKQAGIVFGIDGSLYLVQNLRNVTARLNQQLESIPLDLSYYNQRTGFFPPNSLFSEDNVPSRSANTEGKWIYKFNNEAYYHYQCKATGWPGGGCIKLRSTIKSANKEIAFNDLSVRFTLSHRYTLKNGGIVVIIGRGDASSSNDFNKLYILR